MEVPIYIFVALIAGILSILMALVFAKKVMKEDPGNERMVEVAGYIESGAITFIQRQYKTLGIFVIVIAIALLFLPPTIPEELRVIKFMNWEQSIAYVIGALASMWAGWLGMKVGVKANTRTAQACTIGTKEGFNVAFFGGAVMGLAVVGAALIGVSLLYMWIPSAFVVLGFSFDLNKISSE